MTDLRTPPVNDGDLFSERARQYAQEKPLQRIHILEAGCGWGSGLDLGDRECQVTGVDLETPALRAHTGRRPDLDSWYLGDLRTVPMPPRAYDLVHTPFLIERVPHAELVLDRFVAALKPGGLLLIRLRDRNTAFGFLDSKLPRWMRGPAWRRAGLAVAESHTVTTRGASRASAAGTRRVTPRAGNTPGVSGAGQDLVAVPVDERAAVEAAIGERVVDETNGRPTMGAEAGVPSADGAYGSARGRITPPPAALYDRVASRQGMQWYCVMRGLVIAEEYTTRHALDALGAGTGLAAGLCRLVSLVSRGRLTADHSEVTLVIRKPENRFARVI